MVTDSSLDSSLGLGSCSGQGAKQNDKATAELHKKMRSQLRKSLRHYRCSLSTEQQRSAAYALRDRLANWTCFKQANMIAAYLSNDGEIDLTPTINYARKMGKQICVPVLHPFCRNHLLFLKVTETTSMTTNRFGISEPALACDQVVLLKHIDLVLLPLVGFDQANNRLGMGGGFYDRTFAPHLESKASKPQLVGVAHDGQEVRQLPTATWDVPVNFIATPTRLIGA